MKNIRWIGIIKGDMSQYQTGDIPEDAQKIDGPKTMSGMMVKAMPYMIPSVAILFASMFIKTFVSQAVVIDPLFIAVGFLAGFLMLPVHEWLHAVVYPSKATVYIGIHPKAFSAVALASYPLIRKRFVFMCLLPYILGLVPIAVFWFAPAQCVRLNGLLFGMAMMGLISPYPDLYNVVNVCRHTDKDSFIQFYADDIYYFTPEKG